MIVDLSHSLVNGNDLVKSQLDMQWHWSCIHRVIGVDVIFKRELGLLGWMYFYIMEHISA